MIASSRHQAAVEMRQSDFERIEEIGADAMEAARQALDALLRVESLPMLRAVDDLRRIVADRSALSQTARHLIGDALVALRELAPGDPRIGSAHENLVRCLRFSERVADLLAAERHIGFCRGIGN